LIHFFWFIIYFLWFLNVEFYWNWRRLYSSGERDNSTNKNEPDNHSMKLRKELFIWSFFSVSLSLSPRRRDMYAFFNS